MVSTISRFGRGSPCTMFQVTAFCTISALSCSLHPVWPLKHSHNCLGIIESSQEATHAITCWSRVHKMRNKAEKAGYISQLTKGFVSTAIGLRKHRIPSDLRSQPECRPVSTTVGDHAGILGAVVFVCYCYSYLIFLLTRILTRLHAARILTETCLPYLLMGLLCY